MARREASWCILPRSQEINMEIPVYITWLAIRLGAAEKCTVTLLSRHPLVTLTNTAEGRYECPYTSPGNFLRRSMLWNA
jgi:hypothetical protein